MEPEGEENRMLKTFLVEDEVVVRETIKRMIPWEQYGFELAGEASDGEMALPLILKSKPDLLITDIKMPFMDGLELSDQYRGGGLSAETDYEECFY